MYFKMFSGRGLICPSMLPVVWTLQYSLWIYGAFSLYSSNTTLLTSTLFFPFSILLRFQVGVGPVLKCDAKIPGIDWSESFVTGARHPTRIKYWQQVSKALLYVVYSMFCLQLLNANLVNIVKCNNLTSTPELLFIL